jgi:hypothetical protein
VAQDEEQRPLNQLPQVYDSSLKEWIFQQTPVILPLLLPGAIYEQTLTVELIRPTVRMDKQHAGSSNQGQQCSLQSSALQVQTTRR